MPTSFQPGPMATQRFYNPDWLDDDDLVAGFIARHDLFAFLRQELKRLPRHGSAQHILLVGPRGTGKTTLLKRLAVEIRRNPHLADHLIALSFQEELYQLKNLADFWWAACEALCDELDRSSQRVAADRLGDAIERAKTPGRQTDPYDDTGLVLLLQTCETLQRRPVLLVDNVDMVMQRIDTKGRKRKDPLSPAYWALREALSTADAPIMIGGSVRVSEPFVGYDKAFYDFFVTRRLPKLSLAEVEDILRHLALVHGTADWEQRMRAGRGRIQALYEMTGGNPRALGLIFDLLRQGSNGRAIDDFERLLDITTPYYKARIEDLSEQAQVIVHALAQLRRRVTAAEIARQAGLETRTVSAQLDLLVGEGVVEKSTGKKTHYIIAEQLFRIWLQMRTSRRLRQRVLYLTEFLEAFFDRKEVDALLTTDAALTGRPHTNALRDYAMAEWQGDTAIGRALKARAGDGLLNGTDGPPSAYASGDFPPNYEALAQCRSALRKQGSQFDGLDHDQLLGSVSLTARERCDSIARLCDPTTAEAERSRLEPLLTEERHRLMQDGLSEADIKLLYDLGSRDQWRLPDLTVEDVKAAAAVDHKRRPALYRLAWILLGAGRVKVLSATEAQAWLAIGRSKLFDVNSTSWVGISHAFRLGGFYEAATEAVEEALQHGDSAHVWYERGLLLTLYEERFEEAEVAFRKAIDLDPSQPWTWVELGELLVNHLGHYSEAEIVFRKAIDLDPSWAYSWISLGKLLVDHLGRFVEADMVFRKAVDLDPSMTYPWLCLGRLLADHLGHFVEAEVAFQKAIDLDPSKAYPWLCLGEVLADRLGRFVEAEVAFRKAIDLDPLMAWAWAELGELLADHLGRFTEAEVAFQKAIDLDPSQSWVWVDLSKLLINHRGRFTEAETAVRKAIDLDPSGAYPWACLGKLLADHLGRFVEAEEAFRKAIDLDSLQPWTLIELGELLVNHFGRFVEAETVIRKAIDLDPSWAYPWACLGNLLGGHLGRSVEAEVAFRKAIDLNPSQAWTWVGLGKLLVNHLDRFDDAETLFQRAAILSPNDAQLHKVWNHLQYRRLLAPVVNAVSAENWGIVREHLEEWIADPQNGPDLWASEALIDGVVGGAVRLGLGETLLRLLRDVGFERLALPLVLALEAVLAGNDESLANVEPEARTAAESIYGKLTANRDNR